jgi:hypothetical protein
VAVHQAMVATHHWCRVTLYGAQGDRLAGWDLGGTRPADLSSVDEVARIAWCVGRVGGRVVLTEVSDGLRELLGLAGLPVDGEGAPLVVEVEGQPELREQPHRLQEGQEQAQPGDLPP